MPCSKNYTFKRKPKITPVAYDNNEKKMESVYSKRIKAGKRRTYFFDVRETRSSDYYLTITESRKRFDSDGYDRHKIFLYKEDFNKFAKGLIEAIDFVKTELMPDFDFDAFNHDTPYDGDEQHAGFQPKTEEQSIETEAPAVSEVPAATAPTDEAPQDISNGSTLEVDKW